MDKPSAILLGSKPGAVAALSVMLERGWDVPYVVTSPKFTYPWIPGPTLDEFAKERGLRVLTSQQQLPPGEGADFVISYMFRYLVKADTLRLARRAALNFHAGPLPEFGGWAFYNVAILEDSPEYGCTCHYMDEGFDTGPLFQVRRFPIDASRETAYSLERKAQEEMTRLFVDFCRAAESGAELPREEQDASRMRYMNREEFEALKEIPAGADDETVQRHARAFWYPPYGCAYMRVGGARVEVVPRAAKEEVAARLHADDLECLLAAARGCDGEPAEAPRGGGAVQSQKGTV
jgi:methionyl-tRNA formyltransferase